VVGAGIGLAWAAIADRLEAGLKRCLVGRPTRLDHLVGMIVVAKETNA